MFHLDYLQSAFPNWKVIKGIGHPNIAVIKVLDNLILKWIFFFKMIADAFDLRRIWMRKNNGI